MDAALSLISTALEASRKQRAFYPLLEPTYEGSTHIEVELLPSGWRWFLADDEGNVEATGGPFASQDEAHDDGMRVYSEEYV